MVLAGFDPAYVLQRPRMVRDFMYASVAVDLEEQQEILKMQAQIASKGGGIRLGR